MPQPFRGLRPLAPLLALFAAYADEGERVPEYQVKALYLGRLPAFVEWPATPAGEPKAEAFRLGVLGASPFNDPLAELLGSKTILGLPVRVKYARSLDELLDCRMIFICESERYWVPEILAQLRGRPILTVGDAPDFALKGVMVSFFLDHKHVSLQVNRSALRASGLDLSSHLLKLAKVVQ